MKLRHYLELWKLSRQRLLSEKDYRRFQAFQASQLLDYLARHRITVQHQLLLDLGSGVAGYSQEFVKRGARVIGVDLVCPPLGLEHLSQVQASALAIPLKTAGMDIVFCASLIEHVAEPQVLLREIERVLKPGGVCYLSFPPYYSPVGGHEFSPFHYLGERFAIRLVQRSTSVPDWVSQLYHAPREAKSFSELYAGWGLYKMTIRKFKRLVSQTRFKYINISTRYMPISFVRWPVLGDLLTWHAQFLLVKPD